MRKRLLSAFLALCMVLTLLPGTALAANGDIAYAVEGGNIYYDAATGTITDCDESVTSAIIPSDIDGTRITSIGDSAFRECRNLVSIDIPSSVDSIGIEAFIGCEKLLSITIPTGVTSISEYTFKQCSSLTEVSIPSTLTKIGNEAFKDCSSLNKIVIPAGVTKIGLNAFVGCTSFKTAGPIGGGYDYQFGWKDSIPVDAFYGCSGLESITIPSTVASIGDGAFSGCNNLSNVNIPEIVTIIGPSTFKDCSSLKNIVIPSGVTSIGDGAFSGCSGLSSIEIPSGVTDIGLEAFKDCSGLVNIAIPAGITSIGMATFYRCHSLEYVIIPFSVIEIGREAFWACNNLSNVYYSGSKEDWENVAIDQYINSSTSGGNLCLTNATIHYNSTGPNNVGSDNMNPVYFLSSWDESTRQVKFGDPESISPNTYTVADNVEVFGINDLLNKYVLVTMEQGDSVLEYTITDIQPVESKIGTVSATGEHSFTIGGTDYPVREDFVLASHDGKEILYHTYNGTVMGFDELVEKTGILDAWDSVTGKVTIDGQTYPTNYLSDVSLLDNADEVIGKKIEFLLVDNFDYNPVLSVVFCPGFYFSTNAATNSIEKGATFDLYVGYYFDDGSLDSKSKDFVSVVSDNEVIEITPAGWSDKYGQHYTAKAKNAGNATFTVTNSRNNDSASLTLYVIEEVYGYNFDNVPKLTYEEGKVTNFYNHNGMVIDEFTYTSHKNASGEVDYYVVTMNVYNTLDLYGAVTAYNADGNLSGFYLIDKKEVFASNLTYTYKELVNEIGDLFYLIGNNSYYSGESISKKTEVTINVPVGGYIEISNSIDSEVALCANIIGLIIDGLSSAKDLVDSDTKIELIASKPAIIHDILSEDFIGKNLGKAIKGIVTDELKNANWNYDNYGECLQAVLDRFSDAGFDLVEAIPKKFFSLTGIRSIAESIIMKIIPTGNLINFLYDIMGIGDQTVTWITFFKSAEFAKGIYIYTPPTGKSYSSNGIEVIPASSTVESNIVLHSYLVVDKNEVPTNILKGDAETYSITMYKDGKETQPNDTITVRIPLSEKFVDLDKSEIKVYRHNEDGTITDMNATIVDGYAVFETNHLSYYSVVAEEDLPNPIVYKITVNASPAAGGSVIVDPISAMADEVVTITVKPNSGYTTSSVTVMDSESKSISVKSNSDGTYTFTMPDGPVTVSASFTSTGGGDYNPTPGGGGSTPSNPSYQITAPTTSNGTVTVTPTSAKSGTKVTITATPDSDYKVGSVTVQDANGNTVAIISLGNNQYSFTMPNGKVTVDVTFVPIQEPWTNPFTDVSESDWFYDGVAYVAQNELMQGVGGGRFNPSGTTSRGMIATILYRLENEPTVSQSTFTDIAAGQYYTDAVAWAAANKIVEGYGNNTFGPNDDITREQMATILYRYADYKGYDVSNLADLFSYTDQEKISSWALAAMRWANRKGLITGRTTTTLVPKGTATRAEAAVILARFCQDIAGLE